MSPTLHAVIGAGFGDEGKGRTVDALVADMQAQGAAPWVVRFNSGAQAGHTVVAPDGRRHVFHHVGSGAFLGAPTYLGPEVALNPWLLGPELDALAALGAPAPRLIAHPRAPVTVPFDVMINQALEEARGHGRHGSCGVGFGETIGRSEDETVALRGADLQSEERIRAQWEAIRRRHVPRRLAAMGLPATALDAWIDNTALRDRFVRDALALGRRLEWADAEVLAHQDALVFEGAQGLRLDQDIGVFPFVTRSHTGLPGVVRLAREAGLGDPNQSGRITVDAHYITRAYLTRHGAGPLPDELDRPSAPGFSDPTNVPNPFQGTLRFAHLDTTALRSDIGIDRTRANGMGALVRPVLEVTCLDQMGPRTTLRDGTVVDTTALARHVAQAVGIPLAAEAWGPTREGRRRVFDSAAAESVAPAVPMRRRAVG